jgi:hypothetical protein
MTWVSISVAFTSAWPHRSRSKRLFTLCSSLWVAKRWRKGWHPPACRTRPALRPASPPVAGRMRTRDDASPGPGPASVPVPPSHARRSPARLGGIARPAPRGCPLPRIPLQGPGDGRFSPPRQAPAMLPAGFGAARAPRTKMRCSPKSPSWMRKRRPTPGPRWPGGRESAPSRGSRAGSGGPCRRRKGYRPGAIGQRAARCGAPRAPGPAA